MASKSSPLSTFQHFDTWAQLVIFVYCCGRRRCGGCAGRTVGYAPCFGQPCRCYGHRFWQHSVLQPMGRRRPRETASSTARALASLARESSRGHRSQNFSKFSGASHKKRAYGSVFGAAHSVATANFDTSSASQAISEWYIGGCAAASLAVATRPRKVPLKA